MITLPFDGLTVRYLKVSTHSSPTLPNERYVLMRARIAPAQLILLQSICECACLAQGVTFGGEVYEIEDLYMTSTRRTRHWSKSKDLSVTIKLYQLEIDGWKPGDPPQPFVEGMGDPDIVQLQVRK